MKRHRPRRPQPTTDARPPEARLEALVREPNPDRKERTFARIKGDLEAGADVGPWISAARSLSDRLIIAESAFYYLAEQFADALTYHAAGHDPELVRLYDDIEAIERGAGLREDEYWRIDEGPPEWRALNDAWNARADAIFAECLRSAGHGDLADVVLRSREEFGERGIGGHREFWGPEFDFD